MSKFLLYFILKGSDASKPRRTSSRTSRSGSRKKRLSANNPALEISNGEMMCNTITEIAELDSPSSPHDNGGLEILSVGLPRSKQTFLHFNLIYSKHLWHLSIIYIGLDSTYCMCVLCFDIAQYLAPQKSTYNQTAFHNPLLKREDY